jgi:hypothetical protein
MKNEVKRDEDRELTFAMAGMFLVFALFIAANKWVLPAMGIQT